MGIITLLVTDALYINILVDSVSEDEEADYVFESTNIELIKLKT